MARMTIFPDYASAIAAATAYGLTADAYVVLYNDNETITLSIL